MTAARDALLAGYGPLFREVGERELAAAGPGFEVTRWCLWQVHWGGICYLSGGLVGRLTECRTADGLTAVFLDPPYGEGAMDYAAGGNATQVAAAVRSWAVANGTDPLLRIALCGYAGGVGMPADWEVFEWKARGGYGSQGDGDGRANAARERVWFSPHCLKPGGGPNLFAGLEG